MLKSQVKEHKQRLSKHDLIETHLEFSYEMKKYLEATSTMMTETKELLNNNEAFLTALRKLYTERTRHKQKALNVLTKVEAIMVEMLLPFSVKLFLWAKEKGVDVHNTEELQKLIFKIVSARVCSIWASAKDNRIR